MVERPNQSRDAMVPRELATLSARARYTSSETVGAPAAAAAAAAIAGLKGLQLAAMASRIVLRAAALRA